MGTDGIRVKQPDGQRQPAQRAPNGKKFSVTVHVPEEVAARWPEWFTTDKLMGEAYKAAAVAGAPARARALSRLGILVVGLLVVELFLAGVVLGYLGAGRFRLVAVSEPRPAASDVDSGAVADAATSGSTVAATDAPEPADTAAVAGSTSGAGSSSAGLMTAAAASAASPSTVKVKSTTSLRALSANPARAYRVQLGVYRMRANADDLVFRLRRDGYQPTVRTSRGLFFVQIGSFTTRSAARRLADDLRAKRYDVLVVP
jgi:cell division septation protein DedD